MSLFAIALLPLALSLAGDQCAASDNAALGYWKAYYYFAQSPPAGQPLRNELVSTDVDVTRLPLSKKITDGLTAYRHPLDLAVAASTRPFCDWGLQREVRREGPSLRLEHVQESRLLARLLCLRARSSDAVGKQDKAVTDLSAALRFARHVSDDQFIITLLVGIAVERLALDTATSLYHHLGSAERDSFAETLDRLPPWPNPATVAKQELTQFFDWFTKSLNDDTIDADQLVASILVPNDRMGKNQAEQLKAKVKEWRRLPEAELQLVMGRLLRQGLAVAETIDLPDAVFNERNDHAEKQASADVLLSIFLPDAKSLRRAVQRSEIERQLARAALAMFSDKPADVLARYPNPVTGKAFTYQAADHSFTLSADPVLNASANDKPLQIVVPRPNPTVLR